jgi:hypothetical protein
MPVGGLPENDAYFANDDMGKGLYSVQHIQVHDWICQLGDPERICKDVMQSPHNCRKALI